MTLPPFLTLARGEAPLIVAFPHGGTELADCADTFASDWLARRDTDWHIAELYDFALELGATTLATAISRSVIDCNRDPSGVSLYPGQATTELCPTTTFDGEPLQPAPSADEVARRRATYFDPYHAVLAAEIARLRAIHPRVVLWDAHSIRSRIPRLFEGDLPVLNFGTNGGATCDPALSHLVTSVAARSGFSHVTNGRFKGGWTTRHYGAPADGVHAVQLELALRGYLDEPDPVTPANWPPAFAPARAAPLRAVLRECLSTALTFAQGTL